MHFQVARQRVQAGVARAPSISRTLLHHQLRVPICPQRRSKTVGKAHHHHQFLLSFLCCVRNVPTNVFKVHPASFQHSRQLQIVLFRPSSVFMQETITRTFVSQKKLPFRNTQNSMSMINHQPKLLFNCSYYEKLSGYVYDNFR